MTKNPAYPIVIVDDEEQVRQSYVSALESGGFSNLLQCPDSRNVMVLLEKQRVSLILLDLMMPNMTGEEVLARIREEHPAIPVIIVTGSVRVQTIIECLKKGAFDYLIKPVDETRLTTCVKHAIHVSQLNDEVHTLNRSFLSDELVHPEAFSPIVTRSHKMKQIFKYIEAIAGSPKPVLVTGESGTGKELIARAIHATSGRSGEFVSINIAGFDDTLFSDSLFGHVKGAYTGATETRKGLVEQAKKGTLFLDEIGDLSPASQVKLLRLIQENEYFMLGSDSVRESDSRMIFATNADLLAKKASQEFRKDLYYRLVTHHVELPPLRERKEDIPLLIGYFAEKAAQSLRKRKPQVPEKIHSLLSNYQFPGNIRELESMIFNAVSAGNEGEISTEHICNHISAHIAPDSKPEEDNSDREGAKGVMNAIAAVDRLPKVKEIEDFLIDEALRRTGGNMSVAARMIGISPATMTRRMRDK